MKTDQFFFITFIILFTGGVWLRNLYLQTLQLAEQNHQP